MSGEKNIVREANSEKGFSITGREKESSILFLFFTIGFPCIMLTVMLSKGAELSMIFVVLLIFSPFFLLVTLGSIVSLGEKTIIIDNLNISYFKGAKKKCRIGLSRIEKIRLFMGGRKFKMPVLRIETKNSYKTVSGERVSNNMVRTIYKELTARFEQKGYLVKIENELPEKWLRK